MDGRMDSEWMDGWTDDGRMDGRGRESGREGGRWREREGRMGAPAIDSLHARYEGNSDV